jgi:hypothetical protein
MKMKRARCDPVISAAHVHLVMKSNSMLAWYAVVVMSSAGCLGEEALDPGDAEAAAAAPITAGHRVLFDAGHRQAVGNAFWIVDGDAPALVPANPTSADSWSGAISAWGFGLFASGRYAITQLPSGSTLNWGGGGPGDLQATDVFVSDEPELAFTATERAALMSFATAGRGIFLVSDHKGAKRCSACTEAWQVINGFLGTGSAQDFGIKVDGNDVGSSGLTGTPVSGLYSASFTAGPFGTASSLVYHDGSTVSVVAGHPAAQIIVTSSAGGFLAASQLPGGGRLVVLGDSSPADDGRCTSCSASLHDGWDEASARAFILNATAWLAHDGS